MSTEPTII